MKKRLFALVWLIIHTLLPGYSLAETTNLGDIEDKAVDTSIDTLEKPLYSPFIERYFLDELRLLRSEMADQKNDLQRQILDREHKSVDRAVTYATDTVTYFFYLVAAASSILVIVGWTSIRDIKERVHSFANEEITKLIATYEERLQSLENQLRAKSIDIEDNKEEIEKAKEAQSLWLRAQQELNPTSKIRIYDQVLAIQPENTEALTYKADATLELNEPQWAINLCQQALAKDSSNAHAFYQMGCAFSMLNKLDDAVENLESALEINPSYIEEIRQDEHLINVRKLPDIEQKFTNK